MNPVCLSDGFSEGTKCRVIAAIFFLIAVVSSCSYVGKDQGPEERAKEFLSNVYTGKQMKAEEWLSREARAAPSFNAFGGLERMIQQSAARAERYGGLRSVEITEIKPEDQRHDAACDLQRNERFPEQDPGEQCSHDRLKQQAYRGKRRAQVRERVGDQPLPRSVRHERQPEEVAPAKKAGGQHLLARGERYREKKDGADRAGHGHDVKRALTPVAQSFDRKQITSVEDCGHHAEGVAGQCCA